MSSTFTGKGLHALQVGGGLSLTAVDVTYTLETSVGQGIILATLVFGGFYSLRAMKRKMN